MAGWIVFGVLVGLVARLFVPGRERRGLIASMLLGVAGAVLGGMFGWEMGLYQVDEPSGLLMSVLGSIAVLYLYNLAARLNEG